MPRNLQNVDIRGKGKVYRLCSDIEPPWLQNVDMDSDSPPNHLRAWRKHRKLTLQQLADKVGTTKAQIGHLETGERQLSHKWIIKLAEALGTTQGYLLAHDPNSLPLDMLDAWSEVPEPDKEAALKMIKGLGTGTKG